jgi:hypothetical protein
MNMSQSNKNLNVRGLVDDDEHASGFGGIVGANRHRQRETLPEAQIADYGEEPGRNKNYGSRGVDGEPVK